MLGKDSDIQPVTIAGGSFETLAQWNAMRLRKTADADRDVSSPSSAISSALSTPVDGGTPNEG